MGVSRIKYYKNISTPRHPTWFSYYKNITFPTQIFRVLLVVAPVPVAPVNETDMVLFPEGLHALKQVFDGTQLVKEL